MNALRWSIPLLFLAACGGEKSPATAPKPRRRPVVYTTFYPTTYFTRRIAGDLVEVDCPLPGDADPIFWQPDEETIAAYQGADLIVIQGAAFEKWVDKASLPLSRIVDCADPLRDSWLRFKKAIVHTHGPAGKHSHEGIDGHLWLDPVQARIEANEIRKALVRLLPDREAELDAGFKALERDLDALDRGFRALGALPEGTWLYASHPAYNYLARRYGWPIENLALDPQTMPTDAELAALRQRLAERPGRFLLWEADPEPGIARRVKEACGLASIVFRPCETPPPEGDYLAAMRANLARLRAAFPDARPAPAGPGRGD